MLAAITTLLLLTSSLSPTVLVPGVDDRVAPVGAAELDDRPGVLLRFSSAGVRLRARGAVRFIWDSGDVDVDGDASGGNRFDVIVDDGDVRRIVAVDDSIAGDAAIDVPDWSTVTLLKRSEALFGARRLMAVVVDGDVEAPPPRGTLLVLGDSWATGFGVRGDLVDDETGVAPGPNCPFTPDTSDVRQAWPVLIAEGLGVDAAVVAWSGRGLLRDYEGDETTPTVPGLYAASLVAPTDPIGVVVALGHNDAWAGIPDEARFRAAWLKTLAELRSRVGPAVPIVVVAPSFDDAPPAIDRTAAMRGLLSADGVVVVDEPPMDLSLGLGCVWHPGTAAQSAFARRLGPELARALRR